jgi:hypothetical protein
MGQSKVTKAEGLAARAATLVIVGANGNGL